MDIRKPNFYLQWHITNNCSQRCAGCYLFQGETKNLLAPELNREELADIARDVISTARILTSNPIFVLTGGDPMLHKDFWWLLEKINLLLKDSGLQGRIDLLGNPFLINSTTVSRLVSYGVRKFQLSLDGLETTHDTLRMPGSFQETLRALNELKKAEIKTTCMFTLSKLNAKDLIPVMQLAAEKGFDALAFARFCRPANLSISDYRKQMFDPLEYRDLLINVDKMHKELSYSHPKIKFVLKDHLWELFFYEREDDKYKNEINTLNQRKIVAGGCSLGISSLCALADGSVYACRRFPSIIGKAPKQKLIDLFIKSKTLNNLRDLTRYKKCASCPLLYNCRGCGAVAYGFSGSFFDPDPQCWYGLTKNEMTK
jgi:radical SAM/SPASM domain protein of ACGX system